MNHEDRGQLYLLTGLILGVMLGLAYAWLVQPVEYVDTSPSSLRDEYKDQYRALIAAAYLGNNDIVRARARLELLQDPDMFRAISEQAQRTLAEHGAEAGAADESRALGILAIALGQAPPGPAIAITQDRDTPLAAQRTRSATPEATAVAITGTPEGAQLPAETPSQEIAPTSPPIDTPLPAATEAQAATETLAASPTMDGSATPTETPIPRPTFTPTRTLFPTATAGAPFLLLSRDKLCEDQLPEPLIIVEALDRFNQPMPGVPVIVTWMGGEERFYTGLKPEKGPGYADFSPAPGVLYTLRLGENGQAEDNLAALVCVTTGGARSWGAWRLKFVQP